MYKCTYTTYTETCPQIFPFIFRNLDVILLRKTTQNRINQYRINRINYDLVNNASEIAHWEKLIGKLFVQKKFIPPPLLTLNLIKFV